MMYAYVLVVVMGFSTHESGATSVVTPFTNGDRCETARKTIVNEVNNAKASSARLNGAVVVSANCFPI